MNPTDPTTTTPADGPPGAIGDRPSAGTSRPDGNEAPPRHGTFLGACPLDCPDGCSWLVTVVDGRAVRLRGNPDHPFTRGGLCRKVNPWLEMAADPSRILQPLRRIAPKGLGVPIAEAFEPVAWPEALAGMADRFRTIIDRSGPAAIWPFAGTGNVGFLQGGAGPAGSRLWHHLGVSGHHLSICSPSGHAGLSYSTGASSGIDPEDFALAGTVVVWGSNTLVSNRHLWPFIEQAREAGAPLIVIDPVNTRTAARADLHLAPRVGTDGALALGLCRAMIDGGTVDRAFLADHTIGYAEFEASLEPWTLDHTADVCGLAPEEIDEVARCLGRAGPLAIKLGHGMQRHASGGQTARIVSCLPALTGDYRRRGGGLVYSTGDRYRFNLAAAGGAELGPRPRQLAMTNLVANLTDLDDPPVEALVVHGANPVVSNPDSNGVRRALSRPDLYTVVIEVFPTETLDYADLVLPSTLQHEQYEINDSFSHLYVSLNRPAVAPPGECLPHTEIFRRLARALDLDEPALYASDRELAAALLDTEEYRAAGITVESLEATGWARLPSSPGPWLAFADGFGTPSGRFEFASERAERDGHGRLPNYRPPREAGRASAARSGAGPDVGRRRSYDLVAAASDHHINSVFAGTEIVRSRASAPPLRIHPDDAAHEGLVDGGRAWVVNDRGRFGATVRFDAELRRGVLSTDKGWWGMGLNATVAELDSDMAQGAVFHDNLVWLEPGAGGDARPDVGS